MLGWCKSMWCITRITKL